MKLLSTNVHRASGKENCKFGLLRSSFSHGELAGLKT